MSKFSHTFCNTLSLLGQVSPLGQTCPRQPGGERAPPLNLTQIDNLLRNCVHEIFVILARL